MQGVLLPPAVLCDDGMPGMYEVMCPILRISSDGRARNGDALTGEVADWFGLTEEQRLVTTRKGNQRQIKDRVSWAATHLCRAELLYRPDTGRVEITGAGMELVRSGVTSITSRDLMAIPSYAAWKLRNASPGGARTGGSGADRLNALKSRLASGEITVEEYGRIRKILDGD